MDISSTIFDISIQLNQSRYCITRFMYHDMAIYRYIVASLVCICTIFSRQPNETWEIGVTVIDSVNHKAQIDVIMITSAVYKETTSLFVVSKNW